MRLVLLSFVLVTIASVTGAQAGGYGDQAAYVACDYPDGWNVSDFSRSLNGIPSDGAHRCAVDRATQQAIRERDMRSR